MSFSFLSFFYPFSLFIFFKSVQDSDCSSDGHYSSIPNSITRPFQPFTWEIFFSHKDKKPAQVGNFTYLKFVVSFPKYRVVAHEVIILGKPKVDP